MIGFREKTLMNILRRCLKKVAKALVFARSARLITGVPVRVSETSVVDFLTEPKLRSLLSEV
jgi:predicted DNA-binding protein (UPF0251 family)